jgi:hypothetical protein
MMISSPWGGSPGPGLGQNAVERELPMNRPQMMPKQRSGAGDEQVTPALRWDLLFARALKARFFALFFVNGSQFLADGIDNEFMLSDAAGLAIALNTFQQRFRNFQAKGFIRRTAGIIAHLHTLSTQVKMGG